MEIDTVNFENYLACKASAGSGKTFKLVVRYLILLFLHKKPKKILAITFTNKATKEMYEKILTVLKSDSAQGLKPELKEVAKALNISDEEIKAQKQEVFDIFVKSTNDISISTIDKFFIKILKSFANYIDISPNFSVSENLNFAIFYDQFSYKFSHDITYKNFLELKKIEKNLDLETLLEYLNWIYKKQNEFIFDLFSYKKIYNFSDLEQIENSIFDQFLQLKADILQHKTISRSGKNALDKIKTVSDLINSTFMQKENLKEFNYFKKLDLATETEGLFLEIRKQIKLFYEIKEDIFFANLFKIYSFYKHFRFNFIKKENSLTFDDINILLGDLLLNNIYSKKIETNFIYFRIDASIEHVLIDEFQDTNVFQYRILKPIIDEVLSGTGSNEENKTLFFVGDEKQSIYRFRGGLSAIFDFLINEKEQIKTEFLEDNYRSDENILNFVNRKFSSIFHFVEQKIPEENSHKKNRGYVEVTNVSKENLFNSVIEKTQNLINLGIKPQKITVLVHQNSEVLKLSKAFQEKNILVTPFFNAPVSEIDQVNALINYLYFIYFGNDIYLKNLFNLLGLDIRKTNISEYKIKRFELRDKDLIDILNNALTEFKIYDGDYNIIKFIQLVSNYTDLEEFIYNYKYNEPKITKEEPNGVSIFTIHSSKGLEFEHVILMDRTTKKPPNKNKFLQKYGDKSANIEIFIEQLFLTDSKRDKFDDNYLSAKNNDKNNTEIDDKNLVYVAFTRAKESLIILKSNKDSSFKDLNLHDEIIGKIEHQIETPHQNKFEFIFDNNFVEKNYGSQNESINEEKNNENIDDIFRDFKEREKQLFYTEFGSALHETLEIMSGFNLESLSSAINTVSHRYPILTEIDKNKIQQQITNLLQDSFFQNLLSESISLQKEVPFFFKGTKYILDLLIETKNNYIIIDYKSYKNIKYENKYFSQLKTYINVVEKAFLEQNNKKVIGYIVYILEKKIEYTKIEST